MILNMEIIQKYWNYTKVNKFSEKIVKKVLLFLNILYTLLARECYQLAEFCYIVSLMLMYNKAISKPFYRVMISVCLPLKGYLAFCFKRSSA